MLSLSSVVLSTVEFFALVASPPLFRLELSFVVDRRIVDLIFCRLSSVAELLSSDLLSSVVDCRIVDLSFLSFVVDC